MQGAARLESPLTVLGASTLSNDLLVTGASVHIGAAAFSNALQVVGVATLDSNLVVMGSSALSNADGVVLFESSSNALLVTASHMSLSGSLTVGGDFIELTNATGKVHLQSSGVTLIVDSNLTVSSNLTVMHDSTLSSSLLVSGPASLSNTVRVKGVATMESNLFVLGASELSNDLLVNGASTLVGAVSMSNTLRVDGKTTMSNDVAVWGWIGVGTDAPQYPVDIQALSNAVSINCMGKVLATEFTVYSDRRIKKNIVVPTANEYLDAVTRMDPVEYEFIDPVERGERRRIGFIAQDVESVLPSLVDSYSGFVPDIYDDVAVLSSDEVASTAVLAMSVASRSLIQPGDVLKVRPSRQSQAHVTAVVIDAADKSGGVSVRLQQPLPEATTTVFVVGRRVADLKMINHEQIGCVAIGAIKAMHAAMVSLQAEVSSLKLAACS